MFLNFIDEANKLPLNPVTLHEPSSHYDAKLQSGPGSKRGLWFQHPFFPTATSPFGPRCYLAK